MPEFFWPVVGSILAGGLIGFEREFRGRPAGFRTHILVSLASALLMLAAANQGSWDFVGIDGENLITDPTRMAHGVLTGIGFLCAGVIFRDGFSIHGLTTAASLWIVSALGILFGVGMFGLAVGGTVATLVVLVVLRVVDVRVPAAVLVDVVIRSRREAALTMEQIDELLDGLGVRATLVGVRLVDGGATLEQVLKLRARSRGRASPDALAAILGRAPEVREFEISPRDD